jgi:signal transduction histidine kinase/ligand-binding sensor domain-containing protein/DNA-binding response OmpR family regulator
MRCILLLLLLVVLSLPLKAQPPDIAFVNYTLKSGLSSGKITNILKDSRGFMWFGTADGLNRFDGYHFRVYKNSRGNSFSISDNSIEAITEDDQGQIWVGTKLGVNVLDPVTGKFRRFTHDPADIHSISSNDINVIYQDSKNRIWIGTEYGLNLYSRERDNFIRFLPDSADARAIKGMAVLSILEDAEENIWVSTWGGGLNRFNPLSSSFIHFLHSDTDPESISGDNVWAMASDAKGDVWCANFYGMVSHMDRRNGRFINYRLENSGGYSVGLILSMQAAPDNYFWLGTTTGLYYWNPEKNLLYNFPGNPANPQSLIDNRVNTIHRDDSGALWAGTDNGISHYEPQSSKFRRLLTRNTVYTSAVNLPMSVYSVMAQDSLLWVGVHRGLIRYDRVNASYTTYFTGDFNQVINHIHKDRRGKLWLAGGNGIIEFTPETGFHKTIKFTSHLSRLYNPDDFKSILEKEPDELWFGSDAGIVIYHPETEQFRRLTNVPEDTTSVSSNHVLCLFKDSHENVWVGTKGGLNVCGKDNTVFTRYRQGYGRHNLSSNVINAVNESADGKMLICTNGGLNILDPQTNEITIYNQDNGLASNVVYSCIEDTHGNYWLSTGKGISRFDAQSRSFKNYDEIEGLQEYRFNLGAYFQSESGEIFMGGRQGLNAFFPDQIVENTTIPPVYITGIKVLNQPLPIAENGILTRDISFTDSICLSHTNNIISLEFTALNYVNAEKNRYAYKLEGFDQDWQEAGSTRTANYARLAPGEYTFTVKASNNDLYWNEQGRSLKIIIRPPFWQTWWAYLFYALAGMVALYAYRKYSIISVRVKNKLLIERLEHKKLAEVTELKMRFFTNISHEIRTPLTLIADPIHRVYTEGTLDTQSRKNISVAAKNVNRLLGLVDELLQFRKVDANYLHLNAAETEIAPFLNEVMDYFRQPALLKNITLRFENQTTEGLRLWIDRELMTTALYNLLSNAIKFTPSGGTVWVRLSETPLPASRGLGKLANYFRINTAPRWTAIEVRDTGKGIPARELNKIFRRFYQVSDHAANQTGSGIGLSLVKEYVDLHKGKISVTSKNGAGTSVVVYLPHQLRIVEKINSQSPLSPRTEVKPVPVGSPEETSVCNTSGGQNNPDLQRPRVLLVEDDPDLCRYLSQGLEKSFRVETAGDGQCGLEKALAILPDLIISDVAMPLMDGFTLCRNLKSNWVSSHIPVILLTSRTLEEDVVAGYVHKADAYVAKPFSLRIIEAQSKALIHSRAALREKYQKMMLLEPSAVVVESEDEKFLKKLMEHVDTNIQDPEFDVTRLVDEMGMSHTVIYKKLKSLTGYTLVDFIKQIRLKKAAMLLQKEKLPVAEVGYLVGFSDPRYFSKCFTKEFGKTPREYTAEYADKE